MRHPSLILLSHDHHHGLALALRCRKQALGQMKPIGAQGLRQRAEQLRNFILHDLERHFEAEEEILFPLIRACVPESDRLVEDLLREHEQIRQGVTHLADGGVSKILFDLGDLLERHIRREERELFPLFESRVPAVQAEEVKGKIEKVLAAQDG